MRENLYCYAASLKNKPLSNIPIVCTWILLAVFLIPLMLFQIIWGMIILFFYVLFYFLIKRERDQYCRGLLNIGLFLLFLGIEFSVLTQFQYKVSVSLFVTIFIFIIAYELFFFISVKKNMYSKRNPHKITVGNIIVPLILGETGIWAGRLIAGSASNDIILHITIFLCSLLITYAVTFFQKYFIFKIIK